MQFVFASFMVCALFSAQTFAVQSSQENEAVKLGTVNDYTSDVPELKCPGQKRFTADDTVECYEHNFEVIEVIGRRPLPMTIGLTGKYSIDREFIESNNKGNGNITDMLTILPGIQASEEALDVERQGEIRSQLISISGAQPWQTGFFFDGVANNSLIDPGASQRSVATVNDVQGHPQSTFINQSQVGEVVVYDSNIPAKFGQFSGGVVDVKPLSFFETPTLRMDYRTTQSSMNQYNLIDNFVPSEESGAQEVVELPTEPSFEKHTFNINGRFAVDKHRFTLGMSHTRSVIDELSLFEFTPTTRESSNFNIRYQLKDVLFDDVRVSFVHSPYRGEHILTDVRDSQIENRGGGETLSINIEHGYEHFTWQSRLSASQSENSRVAPNIYLPWYRAPGKEWGLFTNAVPFSIEGGYGDIEKLQQQYRLDNDFLFNERKLLKGDFQWELGFSVDLTRLERNRKQTALIYNSPFRDANLDCNAQTLDCVEQQFVIPLDELAAQFGGQINFADPIQNQAYQDNIAVRGQFFQYRRVYPIEDINVEREAVSAYLSSNLEYSHFRINAGLRAEYDSIFENINIAPRLSLGIDPFADNNYLLSIGVNRYYASGPLTYLIREQQRPYITQYRTISSGLVGNWLTSTQAARFSYDYENLSTPFDDELSLGYQQALFGGILSAKAIFRQQKDQVTRGESRVVDGITIISQDNLGSGDYQRYTLSYNKAFGESVVWAHISYSENKSSASSYDDDVETTPEDELVILRRVDEDGIFVQELISQNDLTLRNLDFSRPVTANINVQTNWTERLSSTLNVSYVGSYETALNTNRLAEVTRDVAICNNCQIDNFSYSLFEQITRPAVTLVNLNLTYNWQISEQKIRLNAEVANILNDRTYTIGPNQTGLEVGRNIWLGVNYEW